MSDEPLYAWVRRVYDVDEPKRNGKVPMVVIRKDGEEVARWPEGSRVPVWLWEDYLEENPGVKALVDKEMHHKKLHAPLRVSLR